MTERRERESERERRKREREREREEEPNLTGRESVHFLGQEHLVNDKLSLNK